MTFISNQSINSTLDWAILVGGQCGARRGSVRLDATAIQSLLPPPPSTPPPPPPSNTPEPPAIELVTPFNTLFSYSCALPLPKKLSRRPSLLRRTFRNRTPSTPPCADTPPLPNQDVSLPTLAEDQSNRYWACSEEVLQSESRRVDWIGFE
jgi:hypothetical protein